MTANIHEFSAKSISGQEVNFKSFENKVLLVVNTASKCGFTPQYKDLEELYQKYKSQGLEILAFPCNQFGAQEPGTEAEIQQFCDLTYKTSFSMFQKIDVNGEGAHPLYQFLKKSCPGILGTEAIKWNFTKFLVGKDGMPVKRFAPTDKPLDFSKEIETELKKS